MKKLFSQHSKKNKQKDMARPQGHPNDHGEFRYADDDIETDNASVNRLHDNGPIHIRQQDFSSPVFKSTAGSSSLAPNGTAGSTSLAPNGTTGSTSLAPNGTTGSSSLIANGTTGSRSVAPSGTAGSNSHVPNGMAGSNSHVPSGTAGSNSHVPNGMAGSNSHVPSGTAGSNSHVPSGTAGSNSYVPNGTAGSNSHVPSGTAGSSSHAPNGTAGSSSHVPNSTAGSNSHVPNGMAGSNSHVLNGTTGSENITAHTLDGNRRDRYDTTKRDSGISVSSNISAVAPGSECSESDLHTKFDNCRKHPKHEQFIPMYALSVNHMPEHFRKLCWVKLLQLKGVDVVRLTVSHTSDARPDDLGFKGSTDVRFGTGTAFVHSMGKTEVCDCKAGQPGHRCSGVFLVMTASHVVFDDSEARTTTVEFFYDSMDTSTIVRAWGVRVVSVDVERNRSIVECRTHDLDLCQRLTNAQKERNELMERELESEVGSPQMAVLISHPHGLCKQVTFGNMKEKKVVGAVKTTKDGMQLADCLLTYDTPTCPGAGGGPVNVIGGGTVSYAFAPHCASKGYGENLSGLGWMRVI